MTQSPPWVPAPPFQNRARARRNRCTCRWCFPSRDPNRLQGHSWLPRNPLWSSTRSIEFHPGQLRPRCTMRSPGDRDAPLRKARHGRRQPSQMPGQPRASAIAGVFSWFYLLDVLRIRRRTRRRSGLSPTGPVKGTAPPLERAAWARPQRERGRTLGERGPV